MKVVRTLIVEDNREKLERISRAIADVDAVLRDGIDHAADLRTARLKLQETRYDLLVLDIVLPMRSDEPPRIDAGLQLLDEISRREGKYHVPGYIIGVTQYEEVYNEAQARFQEHTLSVVRYEQTSDRWVGILQAGVRYVLGATSAISAQVGYESEAAILCALPRPELAAVRALPWDFQPHPVAGDDTPYYQGVISREGDGVRRVYAAAAPRPGMPAAAVLAAKMVFNFRPKYLIMAGISAGLKNRTRAGDLLAVDPCWDWGSGKWVVRASQVEFLQAPHQISLSPFFRGLMQQLASDDAALARIQSSWQGEPSVNRLSLHIGPVASGAAVVASESTLSQILEQNRQLLGIEMETYAIYVAAEEAPEPRPKALSLKAVVDHGDFQKNDDWQRYGAYVSARAVQHVLEDLVP